MARKKLKKKQKDTSGKVEKPKLEGMKQTDHYNVFALAAFVLVLAVWVAPLAALSNCKYCKLEAHLQTNIT